MGPSKLAMLTEDEIEKLRARIPQRTKKHGLDPEEYKRLFDTMLDRSKSYEEGLNWMLEEVEASD